MLKASDTSAQSLHRLGLAELSRLIATGQARSEAIVRASLERIEVRDSVVRAWAYLDPALALEQARARDRERPRSALHGLPIGIKDIIDTVDQPTEYGSPIYSEHRPARDAACVALLRNAGAVILGKTATAEFAGVHPPATTNPRNPAYTPGGSSSGSAAAVADTMVPAAIGTQTFGSIIRPAAFCGIVGFKPSHGLIPVSGIKESATICDTVGMMVRAVEDIGLLMPVLARSRADAWESAPRRPQRIGVVRGPCWAKVLPESEAAIERAIQAAMRAGTTVVEITSPPELESMVDAAWTVLRYENSQHWAFEHRVHRAGLSDRLAKFLDECLAVTADDYVAALETAEAGRRVIADLFRSVDVILTAAAPGEAPRGIESTGDAVFCAAWTLAQLPCLTLPAGHGPNNLPVGIQFVAPRFADARLVAIARWFEFRLDADETPPSGRTDN